MWTKKESYEYINNYQKEKYDRITILRKVGEKQRLTEISKEKGYRTVTEFINECINEKLQSYEENIDNIKASSVESVAKNVDSHLDNVNLSEMLNEIIRENQPEENCNAMTDRQIDIILKMVLMILDGCKNIDDAKSKISELLK